ncbi:MAG TPA: hypothetical protein VJS66_02500 [Burkholderiales bacterium]|nr:hypothetical protein [Burkholderiales bacterium]
MHETLVEIAVTKARSPVEREVLSQLVKLATELSAFEATFESRINANKAQRGEKPTKLRSVKQQDLNQYDKDAQALTEQLALDLASMEHPGDVIRALLAGRDSDIKFWQQAHKYAHPAEAALIPVRSRNQRGLSIQETEVSMGWCPSYRLR